MSATMAYSSLVVSCLTPLAVVLIGHRLLQQLQTQGRERLLMENKMALYVDLLTHAKKVHEARGMLAFLSASISLVTRQISRTDGESQVLDLSRSKQGLQRTHSEVLGKWGAQVSDFSEKCLIATVFFDEDDVQVRMVSELAKAVGSDPYQDIVNQAAKGPTKSETLEESTSRVKREIEVRSNDFLRKDLIPKFKSLEERLLSER